MCNSWWAHCSILYIYKICSTLYLNVSFFFCCNVTLNSTTVNLQYRASHFSEFAPLAFNILYISILRRTFECVNPHVWKKRSLKNFKSLFTYICCDETVKELNWDQRGPFFGGRLCSLAAVVEWNLLEMKWWSQNKFHKVKRLHSNQLLMSSLKDDCLQINKYY